MWWATPTAMEKKIVRTPFLALAFAVALAVSGSGLGAPIAAVGKYKTHELIFTASARPSNPFDTYLLRLEVTDPQGRKFEIDGFYDGDGDGGQDGYVWKARLAPDSPGIWSWRTIPGDAPDKALAGLRGAFRCIESNDFGGVIAAGRHFRFQEGPYIYLQGNFLDVAVLPSTHVYMSEEVSGTWRDLIIARQRHFHAANKINLYLANKGDYEGLSVTPWVGSASENDKTRMDLTRWKSYDAHIRGFKEAGMFAQLWFFADDSGFGDLSENEKNRFFRYAMARTSAFSHTIYVIALEWEEGWSRSSVTRAGNFIQRHNPWRRLLSVHSVDVSWPFSKERWPDFIASQAGNAAEPDRVNRAARGFRMTENLPHLGEEFGYFEENGDERLRANLWANFLGGAAGGGTGSDLKPFQRFIAQSRVPFQRMAPANALVDEGGSTRFVLAEIGRHYVVYSRRGTIRLKLAGEGLAARWFNPRDSEADLGDAFAVSPGTEVFSPPEDAHKDWVLWISDRSNLNSGIVRASTEAVLTQEVINRGHRGTQK
jgi:hypothetical protein